jgi:hypothetical protein
VGSLVRLESERLAVVLEQNPKSLLTPTVKVFYDATRKVPIGHEVVDLPRLKGYDRIVGCESPEAWGFDNFSTLWT